MDSNVKSFKVGQAPWEVEESTPSRGFKVGEAPWEKQKVNRDQVIEEYHPDLNLSDRFMVKSFSNDPQAAADFIRKRNPSMEVKVAQNRILVRKEKDDGWRPMDPDAEGFGDGLAEFGRDAMDLAWDVGSGVVEGGAAVGGGLLGTMAAGPVGTLPGAMVGSGLGASANEYLRQKIGEKLGVNKEVDGSQVAINGVIGGLTPGITGFGGPTKSMKNALAQKMAKKAGVSTPTKYMTELASEQLEQSSRGLGKRALDTMPTKVTSFMSGIPERVLRHYRDNAAKFDKADNFTLLNLAENAKENVKSATTGVKLKIGSQLEDAINSADGKVSLIGAKNAVKKRIEDLESYEGLQNNPTLKNELQAAKNAYNAIFGDKRIDWNEVPDSELNNVKKIFFDHFRKNYDKVKTKPNRMGDAEIPIPKGFKIKDGKILRQSIAKELPDEISARDAFKLQDWLRDHANYSALNKESVGSRHAGNATKAESQMADSAGSAYKALNDEFDKVTGGMSKDLKDQYSKYAGIQRMLEPSFRNDKAVFSTLSGMDTKSRKMLFSQLEKLKTDPELGPMARDIIESAKDIETLNYLHAPAIAPISSGGTTSTSRTIPLASASGSLGALLGYKLGGGYTGATLGGGVGVFLGNTLGSPAFAKWAAKRGYTTNQIIDLMRKTGTLKGVTPSLIRATNQNNAK